MTKAAAPKEAFVLEPVPFGLCFPPLPLAWPRHLIGSVAVQHGHSLILFSRLGIAKGQGQGGEKRGQLPAASSRLLRSRDGTLVCRKWKTECVWKGVLLGGKNHIPTIYILLTLYSPTSRFKEPPSIN